MNSLRNVWHSFWNHFLKFKWGIAGNQRITSELEGVNNMKLAINEHMYELVCMKVNLKSSLKSHIRGLAYISSVYIFQVGQLCWVTRGTQFCGYVRSHYHETLLTHFLWRGYSSSILTWFWWRQNFNKRNIKEEKDWN